MKIIPTIHIHTTINKWLHESGNIVGHVKSVGQVISDCEIYESRIKGIKFLNTSETNSNFTSQIKTSLVPELISLRNGAYPFAKIVKLVNIQIVKLGFGNTRLCK